MSDVILATSTFSPISSVEPKVQSRTKPALLIGLLSLIWTLSKLPQQTTVHRRTSLSSAGRQDVDPPYTVHLCCACSPIFCQGEHPNICISPAAIHSKPGCSLVQSVERPSGININFLVLLALLCRWFSLMFEMISWYSMLSPSETHLLLKTLV